MPDLPDLLELPDLPDLLELPDLLLEPRLEDLEELPDLLKELLLEPQLSHPQLFLRRLASSARFLAAFRFLYSRSFFLLARLWRLLRAATTLFFFSI